MCLLCYLVLLVSCCSAVIVRTKLGDIKGLAAAFEFDGVKPVTIFRGVPYAKPPIGDLRFAKPEEVSPWEGVKDATQFGNACLQAFPFSSVKSQDEDCLYLNIYVPEKLSEPFSERKAVMIFIHGGGFVIGSGERDATGLAALSDAIIVTLNYRLGAFGFVNSEGASPSNVGLLDQHLAIEWVRDNIEEFGGDSGNITIFGESAGSVCVGHHLVSPLSNDRLFQRAILQSGGIFGYNFFSRKDNAIQLAKRLLCDASAGEEAIECLKSKPAADIIRESVKVNTISPFAPAVDDYFIVYDPVKILTNFTLYGVDAVMSSVGNLRQYDILAGYNVQEGLLFVDYDKHLSGKNLTEGIDKSIFLKGIESSFQNYGINDDLKSVLAGMTAAQYAQPFEGSNELTLAQKRLRWYIDIQGDHSLAWPTIEIGFLHSAVAPSKRTYLYKLDHKRSFEVALWNEGPSWLRTSADHADDLYYIFYNRISNYTFEEDEMAQAMISYWTNFAKTGDPQSEQQDRRGGTTWPKLSEPDRKYLCIGTTTDKEEQGPLGAKSQFWRSAVVAADTYKQTTPDAITLSSSVSQVLLTVFLMFLVAFVYIMIQS